MEQGGDQVDQGYLSNEERYKQKGTDNSDSDDDESAEDEDGVFDADDLREHRKDKEAHDYIVGEQDYDPDSYFNFKPWLRSKWAGFKKNRKINLRIYKIRVPAKPLDEASEVLLNLCRYRTIDIFDVIELLELGASPNFRPKSKKHSRPDSRGTAAYDKSDPGLPKDTYCNGACALHWCARRGHTHVLWALLQPQVGADVNITDNRNTTPLMAACDSKSSDQVYIVRELLKHPAIRVNVRDSGGNTALLNAIYKNNTWVTRELLMFSPQVGVPAISVLERQEAQDPHAYEVSQFIFAGGLLMQPVQVDKYVLEPALLSWKEGPMKQRLQAVLYDLFSLKGRYECPFLLWLQTLTHYDAELVMRMIQRKSYFEGRKPKELRRRELDEHDLAELADAHGEEVNLADESDERRVGTDRHKMIIDKYYKPKLIRKRPKGLVQQREQHIQEQMNRRLKMNIERGAARSARELELWNKKRANNALKVNEDFDHRVRGQKSAAGVDNFANISGEDGQKEKKGISKEDSNTSGGKTNKSKTKGGENDRKKGQKGDYIPPKYFNAEDEKHLRSKEWVRNTAEGSKGDWQIRPRVRKGLFGSEPALPSVHMPRDIKLEKHNRQKYQRTHEGVDELFAEEDENETDSDEEQEAEKNRTGGGGGGPGGSRSAGIAGGPQAWKKATKNEHRRQVLRSELTQNDPHYFEPEREIPGDDTSPIKHKLNAKPMVSLSKSLAQAREIRNKGTRDGVSIPMVLATDNSSSSNATRPASSANYAFQSSSSSSNGNGGGDGGRLTSIFDDDDDLPPKPKSDAAASLGGQYKNFNKVPKRMVRTDIGFIDTTSGYARYHLADVNHNVTLQEMNNRRDYVGDDGYEEEEEEEGVGADGGGGVGAGGHNKTGKKG